MKSFVTPSSLSVHSYQVRIRKRKAKKKLTSEVQGGGCGHSTNCAEFIAKHKENHLWNHPFKLQDR